MYFMLDMVRIGSILFNKILSTGIWGTKHHISGLKTVERACAGLQNAILVYIMSKIKFVKHPRSIVRKRQDHPSSLFATVPAKIVEQWDLQAGQLVEFVLATEDEQQFVKV